MKLLKIPATNGLGKTNGCEKAPNKIVENLKSFYLNEEGILPVFDIDEVKVEKNSIEETNNNIFTKVKKSIYEAEKCIALGGDHSITYTCFKAFSEKFENPCLLAFDAHPDLVNNFKPPTHENYLKVLIEDDIIKKDNVILAGIRNWHKEEFKFLKENKIKFFDMKEISHENINEVSDSIMSVARKFNALYVSIDIDVIDPAFAPGTFYKEPAGMTSRELLYFLSRLKLLKNLKMFDIVEINPDKDFNDLTVRLGAKLLVALY